VLVTILAITAVSVGIFMNLWTYGDDLKLGR